MVSDCAELRRGLEVRPSTNDDASSANIKHDQGSESRRFLLYLNQPITRWPSWLLGLL